MRGCGLWGRLSIRGVVVVDGYCNPCLPMFPPSFGVCGGEEGVVPQVSHQVLPPFLFGCEFCLCKDHDLGLVEVTDLLHGMLVGE